MTEASRDSNIEARARSALAGSDIYDLRLLQVEQSDGNLVLSGSVSQFYHKQLAQETVLALGEDVGVINSIHVF